MTAVATYTSTLLQELDFQVNNKVTVRLDSLVSLFQFLKNKRISIAEFVQINHQRQIDVIKGQFRQKGVLTDKLDEKINKLRSEMDQFVSQKRPSAKSHSAESAARPANSSRSLEREVIKATTSFSRGGRLDSRTAIIERLASLESLFRQCLDGQVSVEEFRKIDHRRQLDIIHGKLIQKGALNANLNYRINFLRTKINGFVSPKKSIAKTSSAKAEVSEKPVEQSMGWTAYALGIIGILAGCYIATSSREFQECCGLVEQ